jgi:hypothetical protein
MIHPNPATKKRMTMPRIGNLRAYLAGTGATGALVGGAVVVFLAATAFVAFSGFSLGGDDASGQVAIGTDDAGAPEAAALALAGASTAVAPAPAGGVVLAASGPGSGPAGGSGPGDGPGGSVGPGGPGGSGGGSEPPTTPPPGGSDGGGSVTGVVQDLDETTSGLGLNLPLSQVTGPVTQQVDQTVNNTLNHVGGLVGQPNLGNQASGTVKNLSNSLLGNQGLTGNLLGGGK